MAVLKDGALTGDDLARYQAAQAQMGGGVVHVVPTGGGSSTMGAQIRSSFGGSGTPSYSTQAAALRSPDDITTETQVNPGQADALNRAKNYESSVAAGTNEETTRELSRARDEISVGLKREGNAAMARGADPSLFRNRALASGARDLSNLQGRLADVSLGRRAEAIGLVGRAADSAASEQRLTNFSSISSKLEADRTNASIAETQARLQEAPYNRLTSMLQTVAQTAPAFGGFTQPVAPAGGAGGMTGGILGAPGRSTLVNNPTGASLYAPRFAV